MSNYLSNLAATVVHPGGGVQPRLPGRFEPQLLVGTGPLDSTTSDDAELTNTSDAGQDEPTPLAKPARSSGDLAAPSASAAARTDRPHHPPAPAISPSPPVAGAQPPASQSRLHRTEAARPWAEPGTPTVSGGVLPAVQPTTELPAVETAQRSTPPGQIDPISPAPLPDTSAVATDRGELRPSERRRPGAPPSDKLSPARFQPTTVAPAVPPEARLTSAPEPSASVRPATLASEPFAPASTSRPAATGESRGQTEVAAPMAGIESAGSKRVQEISAPPILGRADGRPAIEPHLMESMADVPLHQARAEPAPTIRVTIGRIEIRATVPPAPPPRAQPVRRPPALPLDQYLQRRNGDKR